MDTLRRAWLTIALVTSLLWVAASSLNYVTPTRPGPDAGVYSAVALQFLDGAVLYRDTTDAKPPGIYVLNAVALTAWGRSFDAIRSLERVFAMVSVVLVFFVVRRAFGRPLVAGLAATYYALLAYSYVLLELGNVTEEYATCFVLAGIYTGLRGAADPASRGRTLWLLSSGASFSLAILTKPPFLLSAIPWLTLAALAPDARWRLDWPAIRRRVGWIVLGGVIPGATFLGYLLLHHATMDWWDGMVGAAAYIKSVGYLGARTGWLPPAVQVLVDRVWAQSLFALLAATVGIGATLTQSRFRGSYRGIPLVAVVALVYDLWGVTLSDASYGHYYLQMLPSYILCLAAGATFFCDRSDARYGHAWVGAALLLIVMATVDRPAAHAFANRLREPYVASPTGDIAPFVREHRQPGDRLWVSHLNNSRFYVETGLSSPSAYLAFFDAWFRTTPRSTVTDKVLRLRQELVTARPTWVIVGAEDWRVMSGLGLAPWICGEYQKAPLIDAGFDFTAYLYVRKDRAAQLHEMVPPRPDAACDALRPGHKGP